jgi:monofunctional biosynthetic peptidoglycan transglycosylase
LDHQAGKRIVARLLSGLYAVVMPAMADEVLLADFRADDGANWQIVNDTVMGGRSSSDFRVSEGALHFSGKLNTVGGGFASVRSGPIAARGTDQGHIRLRVKADGREYQLRLYSASTGTTYRAVFATRANVWQIVDLPLQDFEATWRGRLLNRPPIRASDIAGIGILLADGNDGPFSISISWVKLFRRGQEAM